MNNSLTYKYSNNQFIEFILILILLSFPKIDLINIPHHYQGIRIEDLIVVYIGISLYLSNSIEIHKQDFGYLFYIFFFVLVFSIVHGSIYFTQKWLIVPRYLEYIIILIYFNRSNPSLNTIFCISRTYLILNLLFVVLQQNGLVGEFSSLGYEGTENKSDDRPTGLTGGPWELSNCSAIIFFLLLLDKKQSNYSKYIYSFIAVFLMLATVSRTILVSFIVALMLYFYIKHINRRRYFIFLFLFIIFTTLLFLYIEKYFPAFGKVYYEIIPMFKNFIFYQETPDLSNLDNKLWSMAYRIDHWSAYYKQFLYNPTTIIFGSGSTTMYYESTIFRVLFGSGLFGLIFVIYSIRNIPLHILILFLVSGLSLDLLLSFKIFFTMLLYFYVHKKIKYDYRN